MILTQSPRGAGCEGTVSPMAAIARWIIRNRPQGPTLGCRRGTGSAWAGERRSRRATRCCWCLRRPAARRARRVRCRAAGRRASRTARTLPSRWGRRRCDAAPEFRCADRPPRRHRLLRGQMPRPVAGTARRAPLRPCRRRGGRGAMPSRGPPEETAPSQRIEAWWAGPQHPGADRRPGIAAALAARIALEWAAAGPAASRPACSTSGPRPGSSCRPGEHRPAGAVALRPGGTA